MAHETELAAGEPQAASSPPPTLYPSEDNVAETLLHYRIRSLLHLLVQAWFADQGQPVLALTDQFVYWVEGDDRQSLAPDLLVIPGEDPERSVASWKVWEEESTPEFALEVVSEDIDKDYTTGPPRYAELGVQELVIYDPLVPRHGRSRRVRWQVYRWVDAAFVKILETNADRVESKALGCWLVEVGDKGARRVRLAHAPEGDSLVPTPEEAARAAAQAERAAAQAERAAAQAERAAAQAERERADGLAAEVQRLQAALRELQGR